MARDWSPLLVRERDRKFRILIDGKLEADSSRELLMSRDGEIMFETDTRHCSENVPDTSLSVWIGEEDFWTHF